MSAVCILVLGFILFFLVRESLPVLRRVRLREPLFGMDWYPQEKPPVLGMGITRWQTIWRVIFPSASPTVLSGVVISIERVAGETLPIIFTGAIVRSHSPCRFTTTWTMGRVCSKSGTGISWTVSCAGASSGPCSGRRSATSWGAAARESGGQQQRLCIARAIATEPEILLMAGPTSALDPFATLRIEELFRERNVSPSSP